MKLRVLVDNNTFIDEYYYGEPAVSYYIEDGNNKILFDTGYSDIFISNASKMNIDLDKIDTIVISHGHDDHTGGLEYFFNEPKNIELIAHPDTFHHKEINGLYIGSPKSTDTLKQQCLLNLSKEPINITDNIIYLGEIPQINDFEPREIIGQYKKDEVFYEDKVLDDTAICYKSSKGLFIITGCSHSGICNIISYAKKVCHEDRIYGVIGGFHLFKDNERLHNTIEYLKENNIELLYPCHCVSLEAKLAMGKELPIKEVGVGLEIEIN